MDIKPNKKTPLVSVVLCVYNGERQVTAAVEDILAQTYQNIELIISDDASTDGTIAVLEKYKDNPKIRLFRQRKNLGFLKNKNFAIAQTQGSFITQQDHDDRSDRTRIARQISELQKTKMLVVACGVRRIDLNGQVRSYISPIEDIVIDRIPDGGLPFFFPPIMFSRAVWDQHGPFNQYFNGVFGEDNYFINCVLQSHPIAVISDCLYDYIDTPFSVTSRFSNVRSLTMVRILAHLAKQTAQTGTNDLEIANFSALANVEKTILSDRVYISEQYRAYAARAIDHNALADGARMLSKAWMLNPFSTKLLRTAAYWFQRKVARKR